MAFQVEMIGALMIALSIMHAFFPSYFKWKNELMHVSLINREMMHVHTFFIALVLALMGIFCYTESAFLIRSEVGRKISFGLAIFWVARLVIQVFIYSPSLWRGKAFETFVNIFFLFLWAYFSFIFLKAACIF